MADQQVRLAFVGSGYMGQRAHMDCYLHLPNVKIVALAEGRAQTAKAIAQRYNIEHVYSDHKSMLADKSVQIDAVVGITPFGLHHSFVPDILNAGKHLLTEKPICIGAQVGQKLSDLAKQKKLVYFVGNMKRSAPASVYARETITQWKKDGTAGRMTYLRASMPPGDWIMGMEKSLDLGDQPAAYEGQTQEPCPSWMDEAAGKKYISFVNYFIHQVNLIRYLLGEDYSVSYADPQGAILVGHSASGVTVVLEMRGHGQEKVWDERYMVGFERGYVDVSLPAPLERQQGGRVVINKSANITSEKLQTITEPIMPPNWGFGEQAKHFIDCIVNGAAPRNPADEAVKDLQVAEQYLKLLVGKK